MFSVADLHLSIFSQLIKLDILALHIFLVLLIYYIFYLISSFVIVKRNKFSKVDCAASQWWSNERIMVYFKLMLVKCSLMMVKCLLMMVKCSSMMVKWVYDYTLIAPSLTSILLPAWSTPSFAHLTIIEKLHQL